MTSNRVQKTRNEYLHRVLFGFLLVVMMARQLFLLFWGVNRISSLLFSLYFVIFFFIFLFSFKDKKVYFLHFAAFLALFLIVFFLRTKIFSFKEDVIIFALSMLAFSTVCYDDKNFYASKKLYVSYIICTSIFFIIGAFQSSNYASGELVYYTLNPNQSGILLLCYFINMLMIRMEGKIADWKTRALYDLLLIGLTYAAFKTQSRTIIVAILIIVVYLLLSKILRSSLRGLVYVFLGISVFLPFFITYVINWLGKDFVLFGQTVMTGREVIWRNICQVLLSNPFKIHIGEHVPTTGLSYYGEGLGTHNVFLEVAWRYSFVVALLFIICLVAAIGEVLNKANFETRRKLMPVFLAMLWHMSFESSLFVGSFDYTLLLITPILMMLSKQRIEERKKQQL